PYPTPFRPTGFRSGMTRRIQSSISAWLSEGSGGLRDDLPGVRLPILGPPPGHRDGTGGRGQPHRPTLPVAARGSRRRRPPYSALTIPPSTRTLSPVTYDAAGDRRKAATRANSPGSPRRPRGICATVSARTSSSL